eukprot:CAMPEP_0197058246 /NCGR_PEP_ID=MMETSP1384-20130603/105604_1 /TAXON_ID=29189 /ORGANISM="Ammonia sp." /LENGTH=606 /DNA_ID=CAMNT_0042492929 /DNA_START=63 /DNA_END=1883 /DNA_ORIENTATION=+
MADDDADFEDGEEYEEEVEYEDVYEEVEVDANHNEDAEFQDDDGFADDDGFDDGGDGWGDDDVDIHADQQYIPIEKIKPPEEEEEYVLDQHGNIISPRSASGGLKRNKSVDIQCWTCSNCKATNKLSWTLTKFAMKCCMCKQDTYTPTVKIFDSDVWDEPSNDFWECTRCTLHNAIGSNECQACQYTNIEYQQAHDDDEERGDGQFQKGEDSGDEAGGGEHHHHPHQHMGGMGRMGGMAGMGGLGGMFGADFMGGGPMGGMGRRGMGDMAPRRRAPRETKPFDKKKERNLRNLLVIGFLRKMEVPQLPTKFFDVFNYYYYSTFDRWDYEFLRSYWTTKKNDLVTIKRSKKDKGKWKNMFSLRHIKMNPKEQKFPTKYQWKLRVLDRLQIESKTKPKKADETGKEETTSTATASNGHGDGDVDDEEAAKKKKEEEFEMQYMDVLIGVVNVEKLGNTEMLKSFNQYSCGYAVFAGNGKVLCDNQDWIKVFKPVKHGETVSVNLEWMTKQQYRMLYATEKELQEAQKANDGDEYCVALTFDKNDDDKRVYPKGAAFMLPSSSPYKLAVSSAKKRWEIEWISANWIDAIEAASDAKAAQFGNDDHKDDTN